MTHVHLGIQFQPDHVSWDEMREAALLADAVGYDSIYTWDHFIPLRGDLTGPNLEGWQILAAWGALTSRVRIGTLVTGNTYRHPAVLANMVATLDHITHGRAILGVGAAWNEEEHRMYGLQFGTAGERLARLAEAVPIMRSLLDEPRTTFHGKHYDITDARCDPKPVQKHLPILVGGSGERKTLRIVARWADLWHGGGTPEQIAHKLEVLRGHCRDVGRDPAAITAYSGLGMPVFIRDDPKEAQARHRAVLERARARPVLGQELLHTVDAVVERMVAYWRVGVRGFLLGMAAPFDRPTIEAVAREVRPRVERLVS